MEVTDEKRQLNASYIEPLVALITRIKPQRGLEVGFGDYGWSALAFLENGTGHLTSIDKRDWWGNAARLEQQYPDRFTFIEADSATALRQQTGTFDYIFIDGDHSYAGAKRDLLAALPLLKKGGYLAVDDIGVDHGAVDVSDPGVPVDGAFGVKQAVAEVLKGWAEVPLDVPLANGGKVFKK